MSEQEEHKAKFRSNEREGFDVLDLSAFDIALDQLMTYINLLEQSTKKEYDIMFVEFARRTYKESFDKINQSLLSGYYILFVEAELDTCIKRIDQRTTKLRGPDHHFISNEIMIGYYGLDNLHCMNAHFAEQISLPYTHLKAIGNNSSLSELKNETENYARNIFRDIVYQRYFVPKDEVNKKDLLTFQDEREKIGTLQNIQERQIELVGD